MEDFENQSATPPEETGSTFFQPDSGQVPWNYPYTPYQPPVPPVAQPDIEPPTKKKRPKKVLKAVISGILITTLVLANVLLAANNIRLRSEIKAIRKNSEENIAALRQEFVSTKPGSDGNSISGTPNTSSEGLTPAQVYARCADSVVAINCTVSSSFGQATSAGSGFILTEDGYIVSNYHVVDDSQGITVVTNDGSEYTATYIGGDASNDIALLKIEGQGLSAVTIGKSSDLIVGDQVVAIGNALGELASSLSVGFVSAMDRIVATDGTQINMIQTDTAINSGNSGGPLFNLKGEVIGITTAKYSGNSMSGATIEGIGFAIPTDDVMGMIGDLKEFGYITGGYLGVTVSNMTKSDAQKYGLPMGVLIHEVTAGSCADKGGMKSQDILIELGGYEIGNLNDLTRALREFKAGDEITAVVHRVSEGGEVILTLVLDTKPTTPAPTGVTIPENGSTEDWFDYFFGN